MSEIKQTNFRIEQESADAFRKFCEEKGMNQAQGFDHIMKVLELNKAKDTIPERLTEIEEFERLVKNIMGSYLHSLEICQNAEARAKEQYMSDLQRKDDQLKNLADKCEKLKIQNDDLKAAADEAAKIADQKAKEAEAAEKMRVAAEKTAEDKTTISDILTTKLDEAEKKAEERDELAAQMESLRDELRTAKSEAETARLTAVAELTEAHGKEIAAIRSKLDARTDELLQAQKRIAELEREAGK